MSNYWAIKRFKEEPIMVTEKQAKQSARALQDGKEFIVINNQMVNSKSISAIEETREALPEDNTYLLGEGQDKSDPPSPIYDLEGAVVTNWYKKPVSNREWSSYYRAMPGYHLLQNDASGVWIAWRRPEMYNDNRPREGIFACNEEESELLWKREMVRANYR